MSYKLRWQKLQRPWLLINLRIILTENKKKIFIKTKQKWKINELKASDPRSENKIMPISRQVSLILSAFGNLKGNYTDIAIANTKSQVQLNPMQLHHKFDVKITEVPNVQNKGQSNIKIRRITLELPLLRIF
jgi:hypothetical protein